MELVEPVEPVEPVAPVNVEVLSLVGRRRDYGLGGRFGSRRSLKVREAIVVILFFAYYRIFVNWFTAAGLPANAPAVLSAPSQRVGPNFGTVGAMMP